MVQPIIEQTRESQLPKYLYHSHNVVQWHRQITTEEEHNKHETIIPPRCFIHKGNKYMLMKTTVLIKWKNVLTRPSIKACFIWPNHQNTVPTRNNYIQDFINKQVSPNLLAHFICVKRSKHHTPSPIPHPPSLVFFLFLWFCLFLFCL